MEDLSKSWWIPVAVGAVSLVAGIVLIAAPEASLTLVSVFAGVTMLAIGLMTAASALGDDETAVDRTLRVILGVLTIVAGMVVIRHPGETVLVLILAIGIWMVLDGIVDALHTVFQAGTHKLARLLGSFVAIAIGLLILSLPEESLRTLALLVGIGFVLRGALWIVVGFSLRGDRPAAGGASVHHGTVAHPGR